MTCRPPAVTLADLTLFMRATCRGCRDAAGRGRRGAAWLQRRASAAEQDGGVAGLIVGAAALRLERAARRLTLTAASSGAVPGFCRADGLSLASVSGPGPAPPALSQPRDERGRYPGLLLAAHRSRIELGSVKLSADFALTPAGARSADRGGGSGEAGCSPGHGRLLQQVLPAEGLHLDCNVAFSPSTTGIDIGTPSRVVHSESRRSAVDRAHSHDAITRFQPTDTARGTASRRRSA